MGRSRTLPYAERTTVSPEKSKAEIERTLTRFGADAFMYAWSDDAAVIQFRMNGEHGQRQVRFYLPMPDKDARQFKFDRRGYMRSDNAALGAWEQEVRRRWRSLALSIKAKLDTVESGIFTFDEEFMPHIVLPDGRTTGEWLKPQLDEAYESGAMPSEMRLAIPEKT